MDTSTTLIFIFSVLGILDTVYLSYHAIKKTPVACLFFPKEWCLKVQYSKQSKTFGISNSFLGLIMYLLILFLFWGHTNGLPFPLWWVQFLVGFGFLFSLYFTFVQAFILRAFCTWCVVSAINFTVLTVAVFIL